MSACAAPRVRALIVDDEPLARDCIRLALAAHPSIEVVAECSDGDSALDVIRQTAPDLVFLDVQMPGLSGFDVIREIGVDQMPVIVFVTAHDTHALAAFEAHALDYVLKPFDDERFASAVTRACALVALHDRRAIETRLEAMLARHAAALGEPAPTEIIVRFMVRDGDRFAPVRAADVDWFEAEKNYVVLHTRTGQHRIRMTLRDLSTRLDPRQFARVHRSAIVNIDRIKEIQPWFGGDFVAILHNTERLRVSRTFAPMLLQSR